MNVSRLVRRRLRLSGTMIAGSILALALSYSASANSFAVGYRSSSNYDGIEGNQEIRTDVNPPTGIVFAHPVQAFTNQAGDFVALGTTKGPAVSYCPSDYDALWSTYVDYVINGVYTCRQITHNAYGVGANPSFVLFYGYCESALANRWVMEINGTQVWCVSTSNHSAWEVVAGLESGGTSAYNIDVKYTNMMTSYLSAGYIAMNALFDIAPGYSRDFIDSERYNVYLAPLN